MKLSNQNKIVVSILSIFLVLIVGYAVFSESLNIGGTASVNGEFSIIFNEVGVIKEDGSAGATAQISTNKKSLTVSVPKLEYPGAYAEIPVTIKNTGTISAKLKGIATSGLNGNDIKVTYSGVVQDEVMGAQEQRNMLIRVTWDSASTNNAANIMFTITLNYEQSSGVSVTVPSGTQMTNDMFNWSGETIISGLSEKGIEAVKANGGYLIIPEGVTEIEGANYDYVNETGTFDKGFSPFAIGGLTPATATEEQKLDPNINIINYVVFPSTLKKIGNYAFAYCTYLTGTVLLPESLEEIGVGAFSDTGVNGNLVIPNSVSKLGEFAFSNTLITSLKIGSGITTINLYAFNDCDNLGGELLIPDNVTSIGNNAFEGSAITSVRFGSGVKTIGRFAFAYCNGLVGELFIPDNVENVDGHAFYVEPGPYNKLTSISISSNTSYLYETFLYRPTPTIRK